MKITQKISSYENELKRLEKRIDADIKRSKLIKEKLARVAEIFGTQFKVVKSSAKFGKGMSASGRKRVAMAQKKRWAKFYASKNTAKN